MSLALRMTDGTDRLDARGFRTLLVAALGRGGEGMVACDADDEIVFACPRAARLLERMGGAGCLPDVLRELVAEFRARRGGETTRRLVLRDAAVHVTIASAPTAGPAIGGMLTLVWLREEVRRDDRLYAVLHERYGLSRRTFQLALLVRQGLKNRDIAHELRLSEATVKIYLHHLYRACGVPSRTALVALMERWRERT